MATEFTQNNYTVIIEGVDFTKYVHFPIKVSELLDEQLDEASLVLLRTWNKNIPPFSRVVIQVWNGEFNSDTVTVKTFFVSSDSAEELPVGS